MSGHQNRCLVYSEGIHINCLGTKNGVWCVERKMKLEMSIKHIYTYPKLNQMDGGSRKL